MDSQFIENTFNPFFKDLIIINYKLRQNLELTDEQKKIFFNLKFLIPIYFRILNNDKLEISDILKTDFENKPAVGFASYANHHPSYDNQESTDELYQ